MKKNILQVIFLSLFLLSNIQLRGNPISLNPPEFYVSELMFDSEGKWMIELHSYSFDIPESVDSIRITSSSGSAKWKNPIFTGMGSDQVFVLKKEDLDTDLIIHPEGDSVQIATYYQEGTWWGSEGNVSTHN